MPVDTPHHYVDEDRLSNGLERLTEAIPRRASHVEAFGSFVRTAPDQDIVRINPIRFGQRLIRPWRH